MAEPCSACPRFKKNPPNEATEELHECPYQADVNNDPTPICDCCEDCASECAADI